MITRKSSNVTMSSPSMEQETSVKMECIDDIEEDDFYLVVVHNPNDKDESQEQQAKSKHPKVKTEVKKEKENKSSEIRTVRVLANKKFYPSVSNFTKIKKELTPPPDLDFESSMDTFFITNNIPAKVPATVIKNEDDNSLDIADTKVIKTQESIHQDLMPAENQPVNIQEISDQNLINVITEDGTIHLKNDAVVQYLIDSGQLIMNDDHEDTQEVILEGDEQQIQTLDGPELVLEYAEDGTLTTVQQETVDMYLCNCGKQFADFEVFAKHQDEHKEYIEEGCITTVLQDSVETLLCNCGRLFRNLDEFGEHQHEHNLTVNHQCEMCGSIFQSAELLRDHMLSHEVKAVRPKLKVSRVKAKHTPVKQPLANQIMIKQASTNQTIDSKPQNDARYFCETCNRGYKHEMTYKRHILSHNKQRQFECDICYKRFTQKICLQNHIMKHRSPVTCSHCDLIFKGKETFEHHKVNGICPKLSKEEMIQMFKQEIVKNHKLVCYVCVLCKESFESEIILENHVKKSHIIDSTDLICYQCGEEALSKEELQAHTLIHQRNKKLFPCNSCDKVYLSHARLMIHERVHTNERPFACPLCPLTFKTNTHLRTHHLTHTKEKKFGCSVCMKSFALKGNLVAHLRTHTGEKPYVCPLCSDQFMDSKHLKKHRYNEHPECDVPWDQYLSISYTRASSLMRAKM